MTADGRPGAQPAGPAARRLPRRRSRCRPAVRRDQSRPGRRRARCRAGQRGADRDQGRDGQRPGGQRPGRGDPVQHPVRPRRPRLPGRRRGATAKRADHRGPPGLVRHLLQRVPGQLLAPVDDRGLGHAPDQAGRGVEDRAVPLHGPRLQPSGRDHQRRIGSAGNRRAHAAAGAVHRRRLVLVRHHRRRRRDDADRGRLARARTEPARRAGSASGSPRSTSPTS